MAVLKKPELLSPAGDMEKLKTAVAYGADAVYLGGHHFSLRAGAGNFDGKSMEEAVDYAHARGVKVYVAVNIFAFNRDLASMRGYFRELADLGVDALIISDPGVFKMARQEAPDLEIHVSTQANVTNYESALFWYDMGARRVILARELPLSDIQIMRAHLPADMALEAFVHGAMCIAYSGRCLLSHYMTGRSANHGECAHPCRYQYHVAEETRPGQFLPVEEDERGVTLFSSNDLCMVDHLPALIAAGVDGFKIEGRMKTPFYVGVATQTYRRAIDTFVTEPTRYEAEKHEYVRRLEQCAHRGTPGFTTGFYFGPPGKDAQDYTGTPYTRTRVFVGVVVSYDGQSGLAVVEQRNKFRVGDTVEVIRAKGESFSQPVRDMRDEQGNPLHSAPHPRQMIYLRLDYPAEPLDMLCIPFEQTPEGD